MYEIRKTKAAATCGGSRSNCSTYQNHPDYIKIRKQDRNIPKDEYAFFIDYGLNGRGYCLCYKHALKAVKAIKSEVLAVEIRAKELEWV